MTTDYSQFNERIRRLAQETQQSIVWPLLWSLAVLGASFFLVLRSADGDQWSVLNRLAILLAISASWASASVFRAANMIGTSITVLIATTELLVHNRHEEENSRAA